jgi:hypothetical protein
MANRVRARSYGRLAALLTVLLLTACAAREPAPGERLGLSPESGVLVLSLTRTGVRDFPIMVEVRGIDRFLRRVIELPAAGARLDWPAAPGLSPTPADRPTGRLAVVELPPGRYEIYHWWGTSMLYGFDSNGYQIYSDRLSLKFTVLPGEVTYAGSLRFVLPERVKYLTIDTPGTYRLEAGDDGKSDLPLLLTRYPDLDSERVKTRLLESPYAGQPLGYWVINYKDPGPFRLMNP